MTQREPEHFKYLRLYTCQHGHIFLTLHDENSEPGAYCVMSLEDAVHIRAALDAEIEKAAAIQRVISGQTVAN